MRNSASTTYPAAHMSANQKDGGLPQWAGPYAATMTAHWAHISAGRNHAAMEQDTRTIWKTKLGFRRDIEVGMLFSTFSSSHRTTSPVKGVSILCSQMRLKRWVKALME